MSTCVGANYRPWATPRQQQEGRMPIVNEVTEAVWERHLETVDKTQRQLAVRWERQTRHPLALHGHGDATCSWHHEESRDADRTPASPR